MDHFRFSLGHPSSSIDGLKKNSGYNRTFFLSSYDLPSDRHEHLIVELNYVDFCIVIKFDLHAQVRSTVVQ